ncbi:MAG: hypothetical protein WBQ44_11705, partial [Rhodococcus sp. (in: high G+C Gram-positive bacteria)]
MKSGRKLSVAALALVALVAVLPGQHLVSETDAAWTDSEYVSGAVASGSWTTSGYGRAVAARVNGAGGISVLPTGPNALPWNGSAWEHNSLTPGTTTTGGSGPYESQPAVVGVNSLRMDGNGNSAVGASACGSYIPGAQGTPTYCTSGTPTASATATVSSMRLTGTLASVGLFGVISLINSDIVSINGSTQAISASASCDLVAGTSSRTPARAGNISGANPNGTVRVGPNTVRIPNPGSTTGPLTLGDQLLTGYRNVRLTSAASEPGSPSAFSSLTLTGTWSLLGLGVLGLSFSVDLVNAQCGPGTAPDLTAFEESAASAILRT